MVRELEAELVVDAGADLGEGPVWHDGHVYWIDIMGERVHRYDPASGQDESCAVGQPVGALVPRASGGFVLAVRDGFAVLPSFGAEPELLVPVEREVVENRMNDGKCDPEGRFWASTMAFEATEGAGTLYRLDPDLSVEAKRSDLTIGNGLDWTEDGRTMYFIDSMTGGVDAFDFDVQAGEMSNRRRAVEIPSDDGMPDGMTLDADGYLWVALWGGSAVRRYAPNGDVDTVVQLPVAQVTACTFGGADLDELYITTAAQGLSDTDAAAQPSAGGLFRVRPGERPAAHGLRGMTRCS